MEKTFSPMDEYIQSLYKISDIQKIFSCSKPKAYDIIHIGGFPKIQIGRQFYIVPRDLERWLKANTNKHVC